MKEGIVCFENIALNADAQKWVDDGRGGMRPWRISNDHYGPIRARAADITSELLGDTYSKNHKVILFNSDQELVMDMGQPSAKKIIGTEIIQLNPEGETVKELVLDASTLGTRCSLPLIDGGAIIVEKHPHRVQIYSRHIDTYNKEKFESLIFTGRR